MSYEKQTWKTGDIITSEGLNHIEDGIANNNIYFLNIIETLDEDNNVTIQRLDKTFTEIEQAVSSNKMIIFKKQRIFSEEESATLFSFLQGIGKQDGRYVLSTTEGDIYSCNDKNDYPISKDSAHN